jgi:tetratricopeptide (TPR) repeat protein
MPPGRRQAGFVVVGSHSGPDFCRPGQWDHADQDFTKSIELVAKTFDNWYERALVRLAKGDKPGFQAACAEMLKRFAKTRAPETAHFVAWTCALAPKVLADLTPGWRSMRLNSTPYWTQYAQGLGAILYRAGRFDEAVRELEEVDLLEKQGGANFSSPRFSPRSRFRGAAAGFPARIVNFPIWQ